MRGLTFCLQDETSNPGDPVDWIHCDAYDLDSVTKALAGADILIYLIHSMVPSSRLTQASFQDLDLLIADNFAKAAKAVGVKQIIYVGGLMPDDEGEGETSEHLSSRFEVEQVLQATGIPVSTLRCGMIVGRGLFTENPHQSRRRLPIMGLQLEYFPNATDCHTGCSWAVHLCLEHPETYTGSFDIGGPERLAYRDLIAMTAEVMEKRRLMFLMPFISVVFSKRWVAVFSSSSVDLVGPLIDSLRHTMLVTPNRLQHN